MVLLDLIQLTIFQKKNIGYIFAFPLSKSARPSYVTSILARNGSNVFLPHGDLEMDIGTKKP